MRFRLSASRLLLALAALPLSAAPEIPAVSSAMQGVVDAHEAAGVVTLIATPDEVLHLSAVGYSDVADHRPMQEDSLFWIASMSKPVTSTAILMLQDEGKLSVDDPIAKYLPEFAQVKTPSGQPARITIAHLLHHTSGLQDLRPIQLKGLRTLAEVARRVAAEPMQFEPGSLWRYNSSGLDVAGRIVEVVSGEPFEDFLQSRIFDPLGMKDTTFYPTAEQQRRLAKAYRANPATGKLTLNPGVGSFGPVPVKGEIPPHGGGGLFSTASDYGRFCQMLLGGGAFEGRRYLSEAAFRAMTTIGTGELPTGYSKNRLNHDLGWGLGVAIVREQTGRVAAQLSPGSFGHPGAYGTAAWIDPTRGRAYVMMVQRPNMPDNFENPPALAFLGAAVKAQADPAFAAAVALPPALPPRPASPNARRPTPAPRPSP